MLKHLLPVSSAFVLLLISSGVVQSETLQPESQVQEAPISSTTQQSPGEQSGLQVSTEELQKFAKSVKQLQAIERATNTEMKQAVRSERLEPVRFQQILVAVQQDPALQQQMQRLMQQNSLLNPYSATDAVPVLQVGSTGQVVGDVQKFLKQAGLYRGEIDGTFGGESKEAVMRFQKQANLPSDGIVGLETWKAMISSQFG